MTKLYDAACVKKTRRPLEKTGEVERADPSRPAPIPKAIVNLTLTAQRRRRGGENVPAAWTLQSLSCKTNRGMCVRKSGTELSRQAGREGKAE